MGNKHLHASKIEDSIKVLNEKLAGQGKTALQMFNSLVLEAQNIHDH